MPLHDSTDEEPRLATRHQDMQSLRAPESETAPDDAAPATRRPMGRATRVLLWLLPLLVAAVLLFIAGAYLYARHWVPKAARAALPQLEGSLQLQGLSAPVTVARDGHGVPHIQAATLDDLVMAQGFVTAQDRLFQMDLLRRHGAGELAAILGPTLLDHDRLQRTLQIRAAADRAAANLPDDERHLLEQYARGVNAAIASPSAALPVEFRLLHYTPAPWTPRDSILISRVMFEDLTNTYQSKLAREALTARLPAALVADLYPVGSWRDHPPATPIPDLTIPGPPIEEVPLDESQAANTLPQLLPLTQATSFVTMQRACDGCVPGSNNWVVSGAHTASGKPLLANDMHLNLTVPGIWYQADLEVTGSDPLHVSGVSLPGAPMIVVGQNGHIAWGFTNLGADVQDVYIETSRSPGSGAEFMAVDGTWQPVVHLRERIEVKGGKAEELDVSATKHGTVLCPILTPLLKDETRTLALRWTMYESNDLGLPAVALAKARNWADFTEAMSHFDGPAQNAVYADDQGHIGYHAVGRIPLRGGPRDPALAAPLPVGIASAQPLPSATESQPISNVPSPLAQSAIAAQPVAPAMLLSGPLSAVPLVPSAASEWSGTIPFEKMPQVFDPQGGVIATANARVTPDDYAYAVTLNWAAPYRNERIWHLLAHRTGLKPSDMLAIQSDIYSDFDHVLAQRLAYAVDHSTAVAAGKAGRVGILQAADLLRAFDGQMTADSPAAAIVATTHRILWRVLLEPQLARPDAVARAAAGAHAKTATTLAPTEKSVEANDPAQLYQWYERDYALEQLLAHTPPRWLPAGVATWDDLLTGALERGLREAKAPTDLTKWRYGMVNTVDLEHPIFSRSEWLSRLLGMPSGTGSKPQSGDATTVKQVGRTFGPSERFTADLGDPDNSTFNLPLGESGNPASPWFMDQFSAWYHVTTFPLFFTHAAVAPTIRHILTLTP